MAIIAKFPGQPRRRRRLKSLSFLPTLMTLGNLVCGFAAIHFALRAMFELGGGTPARGPVTLPHAIIELMLPSFLSVGAGLVFLGMVMDAFDGLLARMTRNTTDFGGQLDSMADVVTFGVAPGTLMVAFMSTQLAGEAILPSPISAHFLGRFAWVSAAVYVAFTAIRLARFNVEHAKADFDYRTFRGLPSPGAAAVIASLIIFQDQEVGEAFRPALTYVMPMVALMTAFLMTSRIRYRRFHRTFLVGRRPFSQIVGCVFILAAFWLYKAPTLLLVVLWYWASGPAIQLAYLLRRGRHAPTTPGEEASGGSDAQMG